MPTEAIRVIVLIVVHPRQVFALLIGTQVKAGDVVFVPAGAAHVAKTIGTSNGAKLATYLVEKRKPK